jgi:uncharacterized protein YjbJ (UPF0337 family)
MGSIFDYYQEVYDEHFDLIRESEGEKMKDKIKKNFEALKGKAQRAPGQIADNAKRIAGGAKDAVSGAVSSGQRVLRKGVAAAANAADSVVSGGKKFIRKGISDGYETLGSGADSARRAFQSGARSAKPHVDSAVSAASKFAANPNVRRVAKYGGVGAAGLAAGGAIGNAIAKRRRRDEEEE